MKPFKIDLPPIYKGCGYPTIFLYWKNRDGTPRALSGLIPVCMTRKFSLNARVIDFDTGKTAISLNRFETEELKLGTEFWDWIWINAFNGHVMEPHLAGKIEIRQPLTPTARPL